jgi:hypothetical protein
MLLTSNSEPDSPFFFRMALLARVPFNLDTQAETNSWLPGLQLISNESARSTSATHRTQITGANVVLTVAK